MDSLHTSEKHHRLIVWAANVCFLKWKSEHICCPWDHYKNINNEHHKTKVEKSKHNPFKFPLVILRIVCIMEWRCFVWLSDVFQQRKWYFWSLIQYHERRKPLETRGKDSGDLQTALSQGYYSERNRLFTMSIKLHAILGIMILSLAIMIFSLHSLVLTAWKSFQHSFCQLHLNLWGDLKKSNVIWFVNYPTRPINITHSYIVLLL